MSSPRCLSRRTPGARVRSLLPTLFVALVCVVALDGPALASAESSVELLAETVKRRLLSRRLSTAKFLVYRESGYCAKDENIIEDMGLCYLAATATPFGYGSYVDIKSKLANDGFVRQDLGNNYFAHGCIVCHSSLFRGVTLNFPPNGDRGTAAQDLDCGSSSGELECICRVLSTVHQPDLTLTRPTRTVIYCIL